MKSKYLLFFSFIFFIILGFNSYAQEDVQIGKNLRERIQSQGALYDYSDPTGINIKVQVWGYVKYGGEYIVPAATGVNELLGLAGGPTEDANLDELRLFRVNKDSTQTMVKFDYNDLLWSDNGLSKPLKIPNLKAGDILLVPGSPRYFFKDYLSIGLSVLSALISLGILIIDINRK